MDNGILVKTIVGDSLFLLSDLKGRSSAQLLNPIGKILMTDIPIFGIPDQTSLDHLRSLSSNLLKTRLNLTAHHRKPIILYNEGLKGGGANHSCCGSKVSKKVIKLPEKKIEAAIIQEDTELSIKPLESLPVEFSEFSEETIYLPVSYFNFKQYRNTRNQQQESYLSYLEQTLEAAKYGSSAESKIVELCSMHPSEISDPWLVVIGLLYILVEDGAWKDSWYRIRYEIGKLTRRFALSFFVNHNSGIELNKIYHSVIHLTYHVNLRVKQNDSRLVENGLLCEMATLEQILKNFELWETWNRDVQNHTGMLWLSYSSRYTPIVVSELMKQYHNMTLNENLYMFGLLMAIDVVDLDVKNTDNFEECFNEMFSSIYDNGWGSLYHVLSLLESGIITGRCTQNFILSFLQVKSKKLCKHSDWKVREKTIAIILILLRYRDVDVRKAATKVCRSLNKHEKQREIRYLLSQKDLIYLHISYLHQETCDTVLKQCIINIDTFTNSFYGRKQEIKMIKNTLKLELSRSIITLYGKEGIGKSSLAEYYAFSNTDKYDIIWRINASTSSSIKQSFKDLAFKLNIEQTDIDNTIKEINRTLSFSTYKFLLIFDNIEDYDIIADFIPDEGHIILTSRHPEIPGIQLEVEELDSNSSVRLLSVLMPGNGDEQLAELARCLEYNPRNLILGSYKIYCSQIHIQDYIDSYSDENSLYDSLEPMNEKLKFVIEALSTLYIENVPFDMLYELYRLGYPEDTILDLKQCIRPLIDSKIIEHQFYSDTIRLQTTVYKSVRNHSTHNDFLIQSLSGYFMNHLNLDYKRVQDTIYLNSYRHYAPHIEAFMQQHNDALSSKLELNLIVRLLEIYYYCLGDSLIVTFYMNKVEDYVTYIETDDPELSRIFIILGNLYYSSDQLSKAKEYYLRSSEIKDLIINSSLVNCYDNLGRIHVLKGKYNNAKVYYDISRRIYEDSLPSSTGKLAETYAQLGKIYKEKADKKLKNDTFGKFEEFRLNPIVEELANTYISQGNIHFANGNYNAAESYYTRCKELYEQELPLNHPDIASINTNLGCIYDSRGDHDLAEISYMKAIKIYQEVLQPNHPYLATIYNNLGCLYFSKKDYHNAEKYLIKCKNIREQYHQTDPGPSDSCYKSMDSYEKAEKYYLRSLRLYDSLSRSDDVDVGLLYMCLGDIYYSKKEYDEAIQAYKTSRKIQERLYPKQSYYIADIYDKLGMMYQMKGNLKKAKNSYGNSIEVRKSSLGVDNLDSASTYNHLASVLYAEKDYKSAQNLYDRSYQITSELVTNNNQLNISKTDAIYSLRSLEKLSKYQALNFPKEYKNMYTSLASVYLNLGSVYYSHQDYDRAEEYYSKHLDLYKQYAPTEYIQHAKAYNNLGNLYYEQENYERAEEFYMECLDIYNKEGSSSQIINLATIYHNLGSLFLSKGETDKAREFYLKSEAIREKVLLPIHQDLISTRENLDIVSPRVI